MCCASVLIGNKFLTTRNTKKDNGNGLWALRDTCSGNKWAQMARSKSVNRMAFLGFLFERKGIGPATKISLVSHTSNDPDQTKPNVIVLNCIRFSWKKKSIQGQSTKWFVKLSISLSDSKAKDPATIQKAFLLLTQQKNRAEYGLTLSDFDYFKRLASTWISLEVIVVNCGATTQNV